MPLLVGSLVAGLSLLAGWPAMARPVPVVPTGGTSAGGAAKAAPGRSKPDRGGDAAVQAAAEALGTWARERGGVAGVAVIDPGDGRHLARVDERTPLNPASNAKLFTAAAALARLGPHHRFVTGLYGEIRGDHVGDLVLRGSGDPSLTTDDLAGLVRQLVAMGVRRIEGRILVDGSRFDAQTVPPAFDQQPNEWASFRAPVSALSLDRNAVTANVLPLQAGQPARVWFEPPGLVAPSGSFVTVPAGRGQDLRIDWRARPGGITARLSGEVAEGLPRLRFARRVDDPTLLAGRVLEHLLERAGIPVRGEVATGGSGERRSLALHASAPLGHLLAELGKQSDNFYAEMVFKSLGAGPNGEPASFARAAAVVTEWIRTVGAADAGLRVTNGSGLFDANRASADTIARVLVAVQREPALASEFTAQLAIGGLDGTLTSRFRKQKRARSVRAKTGTLARADALSGYVLLPGRGTPVVFSVVVNGVTEHGAARQRIDRVVEAILACDEPAAAARGSLPSPNQP